MPLPPLYSRRRPLTLCTAHGGDGDESTAYQRSRLEALFAGPSVSTPNGVPINQAPLMRYLQCTMWSAARESHPYHAPCTDLTQYCT